MFQSLWDIPSFNLRFLYVTVINKKWIYSSNNPIIHFMYTNTILIYYLCMSMYLLTKNEFSVSVLYWRLPYGLYLINTIYFSTHISASISSRYEVTHIVLLYYICFQNSKTRPLRDQNLNPALQTQTGNH